MAVFAIIGMAVVAWWLAGAVIALCFVRFLVKDGCPWHVKARAVAMIFTVLPWMLISTGRLPHTVYLTDNDED